MCGNGRGWDERLDGCIVSHTQIFNPGDGLAAIFKMNNHLEIISAIGDHCGVPLDQHRSCNRPHTLVNKKRSPGDIIRIHERELYGLKAL